MMMQNEGADMKWGNNDDVEMKKHCEMMPDMKGCEKYIESAESMNHSTMDMSDHDPMQMSMAGKPEMHSIKHFSKE